MKAGRSWQPRCGRWQHDPDHHATSNSFQARPASPRKFLGWSARVKITCIGGGPAGLYFSIQAKKANPSWKITVLERNRADSTFGWGVVFSDKTMDGFRDADSETHAAITQSFRHWDDIDVFFKGRKLTSGGHGFCGIARMKLLQILQQRACGLGVKLVFQTEVADPDAYARDSDLVIASDGVFSNTRKKYEDVFKPN